jgi:hypothetical protein
MLVYVAVLLLSGVLCWATVVRALPSQDTLELALLCIVMGILVWRGALPLLWFYVFHRSGLFGPTLNPSQVTLIWLDVTFVRLSLRGPLTLLASVLVSAVAFVWGRICPAVDSEL